MVITVIVSICIVVYKYYLLLLISYLFACSHMRKARLLVSLISYFPLVRDTLEERHTKGVKKRVLRSNPLPLTQMNTSPYVHLQKTIMKTTIFRFIYLYVHSHPPKISNEDDHFSFHLFICPITNIFTSICPNIHIILTPYMALACSRDPPGPA